MAARISEPHALTLRYLADRSTGESKVISLFFSLDPTTFATPPARQSQLESLVDEARKAIEEDPHLDHRDRASLQRDLARFEEFARSNEVPTEDAKGLAFFLSEPADLFEVFLLPDAIGPAFEIGDHPHLAPLARYTREPFWGVALVNRRTSRFFAGTPDRLVEAGEVEDLVHGQHKQGGWSQARYQRSVERDVEIHLKRTVERWTELDDAHRFDRLAVGATSELFAALQSYLPTSLRDRIEGRLDIDVENVNADTVRQELQPLIDAYDRRIEREALDRWQQGIGRGERAVAGLGAIRSALLERRVEQILVADGATLPDDIVESALEQSADVLVVRHFDDLADHGGIGALLRY